MKKTILIIDDKDAIRRMLKLRLQKLSYDVLLAESGKQALTILKNKPIDLIILDQFMPEMDGLETYEKIKTVLDYQPTVIMLSAHGTIKLVMSFLKAGGADFEEKPIDFDLLQIKIERALQNSEKINAEIKLRKEAEASLKKSNVELQTMNKELEAFSYSISHDLRAPLRHIDGYLNLLKKELGTPLQDPINGFFKNIEDSVHFIGRLIDSLLSFSRLGRQDIIKTDIDTNRLVEKAIDFLSPVTKDRNISWTIPSLPHVFADETLLKNVWINILSNAIKFTRNKDIAKIEIGFREEKKEIVFFIKDNGVGFDMRFVQKLFGVFQRLHLDEEFEGMGIGLATVQRIIIRHGGKSWAKSELDKETIIFFSLPKKGDSDNDKD